MSSEIAATWVSAVAAFGSAVAAGLAWRAAKSSSAATGELTALEAARRHDEMTPKFSVKVEPFNPGDTQTYRLTFGLDGPVSLLRLESMTVQIRDDRPGRDQDTLIGSEATPELVRAQVWGPLRFSPQPGPAWAKTDVFGRSTVVTRGLDVGEGVSFQLERTLPPTWYRHASSGEEAWRRDVGDLLRISVIAVSVETPRSWTLPIELDLAANSVEGFGSANIY